MRPGVAWLGLGLVLPALGAPLLAHPAYRRYGLPARAALSGAAGAVALSTAMTAFALSGLAWRVVPLALAALAATAALRAALRGTPAGSGGAAEPDPDARLAAWIAGGAVAAALAATLAGAAGSSDLLLFWGPKARAFAAARTIDAAFLSDPRYAYMHPYYPPLATNLFALPAMLAGRFSWSAAAATFPALLGALAVALPPLLRRAARPFAPGPIAALVVSAFALLGIEADVAGNADPFLFLFATLGVALLVGDAPAGRPRLLLAGLLLAGAATSKVEGLPLAAAAAFFFAFASGRGERLRAAAWLLSPTLAALGLWFAFGAARGAFSGYGEYGSLLALRFGRLPDVLAAIGRAFWNAGHALPFLVPTAVALASGGRFRRTPLAVAAVFGAFLVTTYLLPVPDPRSWIAWSAARTFAPVPILVALSIERRAAA